MNCLFFRKAVSAVLPSLILSSFAFAQSDGETAGDKNESKVCAFTDVACNLAKIGKTINKLPEREVKKPVAIGYEAGTRREIRCYGDSPTDFPVYAGGNRATIKMQSCSSMIESGMVHRVGDSAAGAVNQEPAALPAQRVVGERCLSITHIPKNYHNPLPEADRPGSSFCVRNGIIFGIQYVARRDQPDHAFAIYELKTREEKLEAMQAVKDAEWGPSRNASK